MHDYSKETNLSPEQKEIIGAIVHDVNNFSTIIINVCDLLEDEFKDNKDAKEKLFMLKDVGDRMIAFSNELNQLKKGEAQKVKEHKASTEHDPASTRILLVDDQDPLRKVACDILSKEGYQVIEASNGFEALNVAQNSKDPIDILISDLVMPIMSGRELATKLKEDNKELKILFMSGYQTDEDQLKPGNFEVHFLNKPFSKKNLLKAVQESL